MDFHTFVLKKRGNTPETLWACGLFERLDLYMDAMEWQAKHNQK